GGRIFTLSDTVGFVRDLPHQLVAAFQSTLEEVSHAELLLHVVDAAHDDPEGQILAVEEVLGGVPGVSTIPEILVLNKCDIADPAVVIRLRTKADVSVEVSALTGAGIPDILEAIEKGLPQPLEFIDVTVPYTRGDLVSEAHERGEIMTESHDAGGTHLVAHVDGALAARLKESDATEPPPRG
ncbi:MAG: GTPase HflX, partial [Demequinaceae bacterium]|nr:GTPase HflX [Demequinaceae bacterium]